MQRLLGKIALPLLSTLCFSCGMITPIYLDLFSDASKQTALFLRGEALSKRYSKTDHYEDYCIEDSFDKAFDRISDGETVFILAAAGDCSHCQKLEPKLCELLSYVPFETYLFKATSLSHTEEMKQAFRRIENAFPEVGSFPNYVPCAFLVNSASHFTEISVSKHVAETADLAEFLASYYRVNNVARFENKEGFAGFLKENGTVGYIYSSSTSSFIESELSKVEKSKKRVGLMESEELSEGYYKEEDGLKPIGKDEAYSLLSIA